MSIFFTSDLHLGHQNVIRHDNRPFSNAVEMDKEIIKRWNSVVSPRDIIYILGDISWHSGDKNYELMLKLNGRKRLVLGNHDKYFLKNKKMLLENCIFESIKDSDELRVDDNIFIMSHYPIHFYNHQYHGAIMLYGHVHNNKDENNVQMARELLVKNETPCKMVNVGTMMWDYTPVSLSQILEKANNQ